MDIYAQVGFVTLVGLITKNGILIVEFANKLQQEGASRRDAIHDAAMIRLRPVLVTSGKRPARSSIGLVLVGGMANGTLFIVPSVHVVMAKDRHKDKSAAWPFRLLRLMRRANSPYAISPAGG